MNRIHITQSMKTELDELLNRAIKEHPFYSDMAELLTPAYFFTAVALKGAHFIDNVLDVHYEEAIEKDALGRYQLPHKKGKLDRPQGSLVLLTLKNHDSVELRLFNTFLKAVNSPCHSFYYVGSFVACVRACLTKGIELIKAEIKHTGGAKIEDLKYFNQRMYKQFNE